MRSALVGDDGEAASFVELAAAAGVPATTLRHYFADRDALYAAILEAANEDAVGYRDQIATPGPDAVPEQLAAGLRQLVRIWREHHLGALFAGAMKWALGHPDRGPTFIDQLLEPFLQANERLLATLMADGRLPPRSAREAALQLVSPIVLALLHQDDLGGRSCRPLDVERFVDDHVEHFLRGLG